MGKSSCMRFIFVGCVNGVQHACAVLTKMLKYSILLGKKMKKKKHKKLLYAFLFLVFFPRVYNSLTQA